VAVALLDEVGREAFFPFVEARRVPREQGCGRFLARFSQHFVGCKPCGEGVEC
jgi:hypothetical protein